MPEKTKIGGEGMAKEMSMVYSIAGKIASSFGSSMSNAQKKLDGLKQTAGDLQRMIKSTEQAQKLLDQSFKAGGMSAETYQKRMQEMKSALDNYNKTLGENAIAQQQAASAINKDALGRFDGLKKALPVVTAAAGVYVGIMKQAVDSSMKFESAMADVRKVVDFDTPEQFKEMEQDILNLTKTLPMAAEDIAKIVAAGGQSGIAKEDLTAFAESAAKMGVAFDVTAEQAGDMMAKWRTAFKMGQGEVVDLADKINYLGNTTAASAPLISDVVTRVGPLGAIGGVASGEIAALSASMIGVGVQSEVAATGIQNLIMGMVKGESATASQAAAFQSLGLDAVELSKRMQVDARGAILSVMEAIKALPKEQQAAKLVSIFGLESVKAISPLLDNLDNLKDNFNKVGDSANYAGSMEAEFEARAATTENSMQLAKNAISRIGIELGSVFLPHLKTALEYFARGAGIIADFATKHQTLTGVILGVTAALSAALLVFTSLTLVAPGIATMVTAFSAVKGAVTSFGLATKLAAAGQWILNAAMAANPIGLVVVAIAALVGTLIYLYNTNETVKNALNAAWAFLRDNIGSICATIAGFITGGPIGAISALLAANEDLRAKVVEIWNNICSTISGVVDSICIKYDQLKEKLSHPIDSVVNFVTGGGDVAHNAAGGIYNKGAFLTTFAENSPEAAIPLDGSRRAESLWRQTGSMMGLTGNNMSVNLSIPVTVNGNADSGTINRIQQGIDDAVERALARIQHQRGRVSYA